MSKVFDYYAVYYDLLYKEKDYKAETEYVGTLLEKKGFTTGSILELGAVLENMLNNLLRLDIQYMELI